MRQQPKPEEQSEEQTASLVPFVPNEEEARATEGQDQDPPNMDYTSIPEDLSTVCMAAADIGTGTSIVSSTDEKGNVVATYGLLPSKVSVTTTKGADGKQVVHYGFGRHLFDMSDTATTKVFTAMERGEVKNGGVTGLLFGHMLEKVRGNYVTWKGFGKKQSLPLKKVVIGIPYEPGRDLHRNALADIAQDCGAREVYFVYQPVAALYGLEGDKILTDDTFGCVDIGDGTAQVVIMKAGEVKFGKTTTLTSGRNMTDLVRTTLSNKLRLQFVEQLPEHVKIAACSGKSYGRAEVRGDEIFFQARRPAAEKTKIEEVAIKIAQVHELFDEQRNEVGRVTATMIDELGDKDVDLLAAILEIKVHVIGGGSNLPGIDTLLSDEFGAEADIERAIKSQDTVRKGLTDLLKHPYALDILGMKHVFEPKKK